MLTVAVAIAVHLALFVAAGLPAAAAIRAKEERWGALAADTLGFGLAFVGLGVTMYAWLGWFGAATIIVVWVGLIVWAVVRRVGLPSFDMPRGREWALVIAWIALALLTLALRFRAVNFLPWVGDMGAYVNWANEFARTGELHASWPPFFSSFLTISATLFGDGSTTAALAVSGLVLVVVLARLLSRVGVPAWIGFTVAALLSVNLHAIWFATFPGSESLNAPLFVLWLATVVGVITAAKRDLPAWLVLAGVVMLSLGLLRGTAPILLIGLLASAATATAVGVWRPTAPRVWLAFGASLVGALVSYWYGIAQIPRYYVDTQVRDLVPGPVFSLLERAGVFAPSIGTAIVLVLVAVGLSGGGWYLANRRRDAGQPSAVPFRLGLILGCAILLGMIVDVALNAELIRIFLRTGIWLLAAGIAVILIIGRSRLPHWVTLFVLFIGSNGAIFLAIQSYRLKIARGHAFFLYWDRYLFSELIPLFFVLFGVLLAVGWALWGQGMVTRLRASELPSRRALPAIAVTIALALVVLPTIPQLRLVTSDTYMQGAWQFEQKLIAQIPTEQTPIVWAASEEGPTPGFFFPNTWMAFAKPLDRSYGYTVLDIRGRGSDFAPDLVLTDATLASYAVCSGAPNILVFETQNGGAGLDARVADPGLTLRYLGENTSNISLLSQPPTNGNWTHAEITVKAWLVTADPTRAATISCPA
jgi:hypothetical protein